MRRIVPRMPLRMKDQNMARGTLLPASLVSSAMWAVASEPNGSYQIRVICNAKKKGGGGSQSYTGSCKRLRFDRRED